METTSLNLQDHPIAAAFPLLSEAELDALAADIKANGLKHDIIIYQDKILDGRNRYRACLQAKVSPRFDQYEGEDPVGFAVSENLMRRHLDASQRAYIAAELANMRSGERTDLEPSVNSRKVSQTQAADLLGVSKAAVEDASIVKRKGVPELQEAVRKGEASVSAASAVAKLPPEQQREAVKGGRKGVAAAAKTTKIVPTPENPAPSYEDESQEPPSAEQEAEDDQPEETQPAAPVSCVVTSHALGAAKPKVEKADVPFSGVDNSRKIKMEGETLAPAILKPKEAHEWEMLTFFAVAERILPPGTDAAAVVSKNYVVAIARR